MVWIEGESAAYTRQLTEQNRAAEGSIARSIPQFNGINAGAGAGGTAGVEDQAVNLHRRSATQAAVGQLCTQDLCIPAS